MTNTLVQKFERYYKEENWPEARRAVLKLLRKDPEDHWLLTRLSSIYYEERKYEQALKAVKRAYHVAPMCPLVLWDYAGALYAVGQERKAIETWRGLIKRGVSAIAHGECGEGEAWAASLVNDCRYRIGVAYLDIGKNALAARHLLHYVEHRANGVRSIYPVQKARKKLLVCGPRPNTIRSKTIVSP